MSALPTLPAQLPTRACVAGALPYFVEQTIKPRLAAYGIEVVDHIEQGMEKSIAISTRADMIILLQDLIHSHVVLDALVDQAKKRGIPYIRGARKWSFLQQSLERAGYRPLQPMAPLTPEEQLDEELAVVVDESVWTDVGPGRIEHQDVVATPEGPRPDPGRRYDWSFVVRGRGKRRRRGIPNAVLAENEVVPYIDEWLLRWELEDTQNATAVEAPGPVEAAGPAEAAPAAETPATTEVAPTPETTEVTKETPMNATLHLQPAQANPDKLAELVMELRILMKEMNLAEVHVVEGQKLKIGRRVVQTEEMDL